MAISPALPARPRPPSADFDGVSWNVSCMYLGMKSPNFSSLRSTTVWALFTAISGTFFTPAYAACDFALVRQQIDNVLDKDAAKGVKFRREVAEGADSTTTIELLVAPEIRDK